MVSLHGPARAKSIQNEQEIVAMADCMSAKPGELAGACLAAKPRDQIHNEGEQQADEDGCGQREEERNSLATIGNVAGQPAEGKTEPLQQDNNPADHDEKHSHTNKHPSQAGHDMSLLQRHGH
jgi:hypothetical protein